MNNDTRAPDDEPELLHATRWLNLYRRGRWIYASRRKADAPARIDGLNIIAFHEEPARAGACIGIGTGTAADAGGHADVGTAAATAATATATATTADAPDGRPRRRLVVIEEWRVPVQAWEFALPAGLLEPGEELAACAGRELAEETGLALTWTGTRSGTVFSSPGMSDETLAFIVVGCQGAPSENPGVEGEQIRVHLLDREDCRALLARNGRGEATLSSRLWPVLFAIAETGGFGGHALG
ncbi:MAG: NUDIX hydrolase [Opitutaceae bacterium]|jgi:8-oxo-dGTP pyrophosphatase MutT (NUDIX family)|nr:NUDIX hydrolase [Opitutaceae bacterium]